MKLPTGNLYHFHLLTNSMNDIDLILMYPSKTEEEYLNSFLVIDRGDRDLYMAKCRAIKRDIMETLTESDIRTILEAKRKFEPECRSILVLWNELSYRSRKETSTRKDLYQQKEDIPILQVIESYLTLTRYKRWSLIKCPLPNHADWSPSFMIYEKDNRFKCFGCQAGGSQIDFIMWMEGCDMKTAVNKFLQY